MRYSEFSFKNFKGIDDMAIKLTGDVTTLIGLNESGKTTILEAIFCFSYGAEDLQMINPNLASLRDPELWIPISKRGNFNDSIEIQATVELDDDDKLAFKNRMKAEHGFILSDLPDELTITETYRFKDSRHERTNRVWSLKLTGTKGQQRKPRAFGSATDEWQGAIAILKTSLPRILYFPNFLFELPDRFELVAAEVDDEGGHRDRNQFYRNTFAQILSGVEPDTSLEKHIVARLKSENKADQRGLDAILLKMGRAVTNAIIDGWNRIFGRAPTAQEVELSAKSDADSPAYLELKIKGPDGYFDLSERSLGFRWFFMFLMMTSFQGDPSTNQKPLFLLDEPASNLHSSAQAELLKSFERLLDRCSLIYTTHSHHLINLRWLDSAFVVKNAALGSLNPADFQDYLSVQMGSRTSISAVPYRRFVSEHPDQQSYFQPVLDLLDYRPSVLEPVPEVVLVEGKSDFYLVRYMIDVVGVGRELRTVPGGGAGSLDPLIRLHIGWAKSFLVLLDGDGEGTEQRKRYEEEFGPMLLGRCVLLPEACGDPKIIEAENLLSTNDVTAILEAIYPPGVTRPSQKKAIRNAVSELLAGGRAVPIDPETVTRFQVLIDGLNERLAEL